MLQYQTHLLFLASSFLIRSLTLIIFSEMAYLSLMVFLISSVKTVFACTNLYDYNWKSIDLSPNSAYEISGIFIYAPPE